MNFLELNALKISQPLSDFYVVKVKASDLLQITFSEELTYIDPSGRLKGSQRKLDEKRLREIGRYIDSVEMSFPNSVVLAANYNTDGEVVDIESPHRWKITETSLDNYTIHIPSDTPLAAIIDGQHRLFAFRYISNPQRLNTELVCSVFFDLPNSYQAFLFATINGNQKKVDKSLALEQFGFNVEDEPQSSWTPEKLAVYFSRKFNADSSSPFYKHIKVAPRDDNYYVRNQNQNEWLISTAAVVDGILGLISTRPKRDRVEMGQEHIFGRRSRKMIRDFADNSPLRTLFLENDDITIYGLINNFFTSVHRVLWNNFQPNSYIFKTVGIQALFDLLKKIIQTSEGSIVTNFDNYINSASKVDFTDNFFQASGVGRSRIRKVLYAANGFINLTEIDPNEIGDIKRLLKME